VADRDSQASDRRFYSSGRRDGERRENERRADERREQNMWVATDRRSGLDRRSIENRRTGSERRQVNDRRSGGRSLGRF